MMLSPLCLTRSNQSPDPDNLEPYSVFRNEISLSSPQCMTPGTDASDFFSLDVGTEDIERDSLSATLSKPVAEEEPRSPALVSETKLENEILDFCELLSPTPEEQAARNMTIESVSGVIKHIWPHCELKVFGSFRTGLYLPTSDIEAVILSYGLPNPQPGLSALSRALSQRGMAKMIQVIGKARVPIIKFIEKRSGVAFDISFDVENGPKAVDYIQEALTKWPPLPPLCLILKVFLKQRELNEVYSGGIGSYALLTMLMTMLRNLRESQASPEHNLGVLLVHFFDFYGRKLNSSDVGVYCSGAGTFFLKSSKGFTNKTRPFLIAIEGSTATSDRSPKGKSVPDGKYFICLGGGRIRSAFAMAFTTLTNPKTMLDLGPSRSILGTIIRPDPVLLERKGGLNGEVAFNSMLPGAGEPLQQQYKDQDMLSNWRLDYEEEPLQRRTEGSKEASTHSSGKKRKAAASSVNSSKKLKLSGDFGTCSVTKKKHKRKPFRHT